MFKKFVSYALICSQLALVAPIQAARADVRVDSERSMLESVLLLKGLGLGATANQRQLEGIIANYDRTAPLAGRTERLEAALIQMRILSPQQARQFSENARAVDASISDNASARAQIEMLASLQLHGAQFSSCALSIGLTVGGLAGILTGIYLHYHNSTCSYDYTAPYECTARRCDRGDGDYSNCYDVVETCYPHHCEQSTPPSRQAGDVLVGASAVLVVLGVIMLFRGECS